MDNKDKLKNDAVIDGTTENMNDIATDATGNVENTASVENVLTVDSTVETPAAETLLEVAADENINVTLDDGVAIEKNGSVAVSGETTKNGNIILPSEMSNIEVEDKIQLDETIARAREDAKWYVLHTFSGYENVAKENLEIVIEKYNLQERIFDITIPMEDVVEEKNGKRKVVSKKIMPGYILVKMNYGDDIWHAVTRTRGITGFVGPKGRPLHLTEDEIRKMRLEKIEVEHINLAINDKVEVLDGALFGFVGTVVSLDASGRRCRVMVEMFGRETPVDLSLDQIRKID